MKTLFFRVLFTVILTSTIFTDHAFATSHTSGGVIHFHGQIVEDLCDVRAHASNIYFSCFRAGKTETSLISFQQATASKPWRHDIANISMQYVNSQKSLAIVRVEYN